MSDTPLKPLVEMNVAELKAEATERGLTFKSTVTKAELVNMLDAARGGNAPEEEETEPQGPFNLRKLSVTELNELAVANGLELSEFADRLELEAKLVDISDGQFVSADLQEGEAQNPEPETQPEPQPETEPAPEPAPEAEEEPVDEAQEEEIPTNATKFKLFRVATGFEIRNAKGQRIESFERGQREDALRKMENLVRFN